MKDHPLIMYLGLCENPDCKSPCHCVPVHAVINTDELPEKCECGARIRWESGVHRHNVETLKKKDNTMKTALIALAAVLTATIGIVAYYSYQKNRGHTAEEITE